jgi:hypothetical protein
MNVRRRLPILLAALVAVALVLPPATAGANSDVTAAQKKVLRAYAADTWASFVAMTNPKTGLTADNIQADTRVRAEYTSPTNIASYLWSALAARDMGIITPTEARQRIAVTLRTLASMERHEDSGMYYNWYNPDTGAKLTVWPADGSTVFPFLSSVDNGWLAASLIMVANAVPQLRQQAWAIFEEMDFGFYYDPQAGLLRGGFWKDPPAQCSIPGNYEGRGPNVYYTCHHYGSLNTEPRIASYIGIAYNDIPATHYFKMWRTFPETCDWSWAEMDPDGVTRNYLGVDVYEGHYTHPDGMELVPSWGGSMFEALMVPLLVPEEEWGPRSWGVNHPIYVQGQIEHGLQEDEAGYGYWGFSPSNNPDGGYREYGVDWMGLEPNGYASDQERTHVDYGFEAPDGNGYCPGREPKPEPATYGRGVVTPHASFLALDYDPDAALENLANLRDDFGAYDWGGFYDAIDVSTGNASRYYLALDQGMIMAAIANELRNDRLQSYFTKGAITTAIKPLLAIEEFSVGEGQ